MNGTLKVGLLGLGTVGSGVPRILEDHKEKIQQVTGTVITVEKALVKDDEEKSRIQDQYNFPLVTNVDDIILDDEIQVVVELMGKVEPARTFITRALEAGKHVVTANKDLLAQHGRELVELARDKKVDLYYEASVAGGIPILRTIANSLAADNIQRVLGIVNGTTNYMLTKMITEKLDYATALEQAQALGFAESDPTNDVDGIDASYKMVILTQFAFGMSINVSDVETKGIRGLALVDVETAEKLGYVVKLIGSSEIIDGSVNVEVGPVLVPKKHPLAGVRNEFNAVFINSSGVGESMYYGPGAGGNPTATSVVSDLITVAKNVRLGTSGHMFNSYTHERCLSKNEQIYGKYYFAMEAQDKVGQLLQLTKLAADEGIGFDQVSQDKSENDLARIVIVTHTMSKAQKLNFIKGIEALNDIELLAHYKVLED